MGHSDRKALESNLMILIAHLLKLKIQNNVPEAMKGSWYDSVVEHRQSNIVNGFIKVCEIPPL